MNISLIGKRLGIQSAAVERKANELLRMSNTKLPSGLGMGEICKPAVCFELACTVLGETVEHIKIMRMSGCTEKIYNSSLVTLQRVLGVKQRVTAKELCVRFGCVRLEEACKRALQAYKQRFVARLPAERRASADFGRSVFTAGAFYLVARKNKVKVDREPLLQSAGITPEEFSSALNSMSDLLFDLVGVEKTKRKKSSEGEGKGGLLDAAGGRADSDSGSDNDLDVAEGEEEVPGVHQSKKQRKKREYEAWKKGVLAEKESNKQLAIEAAAGGGKCGGGDGGGTLALTAGEAKQVAALKQATLAFAALPKAAPKAAPGSVKGAIPMAALPKA